MEAGERGRQITQTCFVGIGANALLATVKAAVGLISGSIAITLDAVNNLSDALSSVITMVGTKLASRRADKKHPFGHGRFEYLTSILIAAVIIYAAVSAFVESVGKITSPVMTHYTPVMLVLIALAVAVKIILGIYVRGRGRAVNSDSLTAAGTDALLDAVVSTAALLCAVITMLWGVVLDGWLGAFISLFIAKTGFELLITTFSTLTGQRADSSLSAAIKTEVASHEGVLGAYDLMLHSYGPENMLGSVNIELDERITAREVYRICKQIQRDVKARFGVYLTVSIYAINISSEETRAMREAVNAEIMKHEHVLSTHAFCVDSDSHVVTVDVVMDFKAPDPAALHNEITADLGEKFPGYEFRLHDESDYSD